MVRTYGEPLTLYVGSERRYRPDDGVALALGRRITTFGFVKGLRPVPNRHPFVGLVLVLLLEQRSSQLIRRRVGIDHERTSRLRKVQYWWRHQYCLQRFERISLRVRWVRPIGGSVLLQHRVEWPSDLGIRLYETAVNVGRAQKRSTLRLVSWERSRTKGFLVPCCDVQLPWGDHVPQVVNSWLKERALREL